MSSPGFLHSPVFAPSTPPLLTSPDYNAFAPGHSLAERLRSYTNYINDSAERDLYDFFIEIVHEIFGRGPDTGWALDRLKTRPFDDQRYIVSESDSVYQFLHSKGYIFKLCYKLLYANSSLKFNLYFSDILAEVKQRIEKSFGRSYYGSRFLYQADSNVPVGLSLNSFEYFMFHFALFGLKLTSDDTDFTSSLNEQSVYKLLCIDYLNFFLPLNSSASMILPQLQFKILSTIPGQKQYANPCKSLNFIKKEVACKEFSNDKVESTSWMLSSEATWRSEVVAFFFADLWLNCNVSAVPSINLAVLIRCFIKHLHLYSNCANHISTDNLKLVLRARHSIKIFKFLEFYMVNWPQDFSFRFLLEIWICYIQPWRYYNLPQEHYSITESEMIDKWKMFIVRNLPCFTKLFYLAIKRFICTDICSPRYSIMVLRTVKMFTHPFLLNIILDIERSFIENHSHHNKWNLLLTECLIEAQGPLFKYEPMFSEERIYDYRLFYTKLQKSLEYSTMELQKFHEDKLDWSNSSSFLEMVFSPKKYQKSNYSLSEWEDICTNLKSSLVFMEQIFKMNTASVPLSANLSTSSVLGSSEIINPNVLSFISNTSAQPYECNKSYSRSKFHKEWEIDPDDLATLSYENDFLVKLSKYLKKNVESYWNHHILRFSLEESVLAGVLRQTLIRAPMKIYSYVPRNDGSGKQIRTPKVIPPTVSFRWIASYFTLTWIVFLLSLILVFSSIGLWTLVFFIIRIIYLCLKYSVGFSPPFKWENMD